MEWLNTNNEQTNENLDNFTKIDKEVLKQITENAKKDAEFMNSLSKNPFLDDKLNNTELASSFLIESIIWTHLTF